jgi:hypothetical protein
MQIRILLNKQRIKGKKSRMFRSKNYFNLMVVDVGDEMTYQMINTQSKVSGEQISNNEMGQKMKEYIKNNKFTTKTNEKVTLRKFNAMYTAFIPYFDKIVDFPQMVLIAYFRKRNDFYSYSHDVLKFIQKEKFPEVGVEVKLGIENLWFFLTPYIRDWWKVHYISKEMMKIPSDVEKYINMTYGKESRVLRHPPFQLKYSLREEVDLK